MSQENIHYFFLFYTTNGHIDDDKKDDFPTQASCLISSVYILLTTSQLSSQRVTFVARPRDKWTINALPRVVLIGGNKHQSNSRVGT